jgi:hypothetical protein
MSAEERVHVRDASGKARLSGAATSTDALAGSTVTGKPARELRGVDSVDAHDVRPRRGLA